MWEILSNLATLTCPILLVILAIQRRRISVNNSRIKRLTDEKIANFRNRNVDSLQRQEITYSPDSLGDIPKKQLQFSLENLAIGGTMVQLYKLLEELGTNRNSKIIYNAFLDELTPALQKSHKSLQEIVYKFAGAVIPEKYN